MLANVCIREQRRRDRKVKEILPTTSLELAVHKPPSLSNRAKSLVLIKSFLSERRPGNWYTYPLLCITMRNILYLIANAINLFK